MLVRVSRCAAARLHTQALPVSALTMKHPSVSSVVHGGGNRRSKPVAEKRCGLDDLRADPGHGRVGLMPARRASAMRGNEEEARLFTRALASSRLHQESGLVSPRQPAEPGKVVPAKGMRHIGNETVAREASPPKRRAF